MTKIYELRTLTRDKREHIDPTTINEIVDGNGSTPLMEAIFMGMLESVKELIHLGADVNVVDFHGNTPLLKAVFFDWPEVIPLLVDAGAYLEYSRNGSTALSLACTSGHHRVVKILLGLGADISGCCENPLKSAIQVGCIDSIHLLLQHKVSLDEGLLQTAAASGQIEVVETLVKMGMDINNVHKDIPVLFMALYKDCKLIERLLELGANVNITSSDGRTAIMDLVKNGNDGPLDMLVRYGANLEAKSTHGFTALAFAALWGPLRCITKLIDLGADVRTRIFGGISIIGAVIADTDRPEVVELLLQRGAELDHPEDGGSTPLMAAAFKDSTQYIEVLLRYWPPHIGSLQKAIEVAERFGSYNAYIMLVEHFRQLMLPKWQHTVELIQQVCFHHTLAFSFFVAGRSWRRK